MALSEASMQRHGITHAETVELPDGRSVRILTYKDGAIRIRVSGTPYVLSECYLSGNAQALAILKLEPKT